DRGHGVAVEGAGLGDVPGLPLERGIEVLHDLRRAADGRQGESAPDHLAEGRQVGDDAVVLLRAAVGQAEARDDLVEDERDPVAPGDGAEPGEESGRGTMTRW